MPNVQPQKLSQTHEIAARRRKVARLVARKLTQTEIAEMLGVDQSTISRDIRVVEAEWRKEANAEITALRATSMPVLAMTALNVDRSTIMRRLARARERLFEGTRDAMMSKLRLSTEEFASVARDVQSGIDLTLSRLFA